MSGLSFGGFLPETSPTHLEDVEEMKGITNPTEGQVLYYDGSQWINSAIPDSADGNYNIIFKDNFTAGTTSRYLEATEVVNTTIIFSNYASSTYRYILTIPPVLDIIEALDLDATYNGSYMDIYIVNNHISVDTGTVRLLSNLSDGWTPIDFEFVDLYAGSGANLRLLIHDVDARQGRTFYRTKY